MATNYRPVSSDPSQGQAVSDIPHNRTLILTQLTQDAPLLPEVVHGLQNINQVFEHYRPGISIEFRDPEGHIITEQLDFNSLSSFSPEHIAAQSNCIGGVVLERETYLNIVHQLRSNSELKNALSNPDQQAALRDAIARLITTLKNHS